jgi:hypothetical protein
MMSPVAAGALPDGAREAPTMRANAGAAPLTICLMACEVSGERPICG